MTGAIRKEFKKTKEWSFPVFFLFASPEAVCTADVAMRLVYESWLYAFCVR